MLNIIQDAKNFYIQFDYNKELVADIRLNVIGAQWRDTKKAWVVPKKYAYYVNQFAARHQAPVKELKTVADAPERILQIKPLPDLTTPVDTLLPLYPYQAKGVARGSELRRFINGDEPGLGKSFQSIATTMVLDAFPALVICPATIKINWQREWLKFGNKKALILGDRTRRNWPALIKLGYFDAVIVNYESLKKWFVADVSLTDGKIAHSKDIQMRPEANIFKTVIIDEAHRCKDKDAQQTKIVLRLTSGINGLPSPQSVIALTGTPIVNGPKDLIPLLAIIGRTACFGGIKYFEDRYCQGKNGSNLQELNGLLNQYCFFRREKKEVLPELPDKVRHIVTVPITNKEVYRKAEVDFVRYLKEIKGCTDPQIRRKLRGEAMVKMMELKYISARGKIKAVIEYVRDVQSAGHKMVIFCHLNEVHAALVEAFPGAVSIAGGDGDRQASIDAFQNDPNVTVVVCKIKAAGVGVTLTASSHVCFIEWPWTSADCDQCEDRTHRIGQKESVQATYFSGEDTIDDYCYSIVTRKRRIADAVTGQQYEVEEELFDGLYNRFFRG